MPVKGIRSPGVNVIRLNLEPRVALDVYFSLMASTHCEETTLQQRITVSGLAEQLKRALSESGFVARQVLDDYQKHLLGKPAPPPLDAAIKAYIGDH